MASENYGAEDFSLIKAGEEKGGNAVLSVFSVIAYLGVFSSLIGAFMVFMSAMSSDNKALNYDVLAGCVIAFAVCIGAAIVTSVLQRRENEKAERLRGEFIKSTAPVDGKIVGINKYVKRIYHEGNTYEELLWSFNIEYRDSKTNEKRSVESEKYLNDVSNVISGDSVKIYFREDGTFELDGFALRKSEDDAKAELKITEIENGEDTVYSFNSRLSKGKTAKDKTVKNGKDKNE